ncbi:MAG: hypothetical protein AB8G05_17345 [Oligoflexales bacterium]
MTKLSISLEKIVAAKSESLDKVDKVLNVLTGKFPRQVNEGFAGVKNLYQQFMLHADKHPWLIRVV